MKNNETKSATKKVDNGTSNTSNPQNKYSDDDVYKIIRKVVVKESYVAAMNVLEKKLGVSLFNTEKRGFAKFLFISIVLNESIDELSKSKVDSDFEVCVGAITMMMLDSIKNIIDLNQTIKEGLETTLQELFDSYVSK